jgi:hypothetical protein
MKYCNKHFTEPCALALSEDILKNVIENLQVPEIKEDLGPIWEVGLGSHDLVCTIASDVLAL